MIKEDDIGKRIKDLRLSRGQTLENLGKSIGLTKGYLSRLENSRKAPPVSVLYRIAKALNIRIQDIFGEAEANTLITIIRKDERPIMALPGSEFGYYYETLAPNFTNRFMDIYILMRPPSNEKKPIVFKHEGQEALFILDGAMEFTHGGAKYILKKGDCAYFDSGIDHYGYALDGKAVTSLMIVSRANNNK